MNRCLAVKSTQIRHELRFIILLLRDLLHLNIIHDFHIAAEDIHILRVTHLLLLNGPESKIKLLLL